MKKIKLFALAAFAMLSTNAFAQSFADVTDDTWQYTVNPDPDDVTKPSSTATLLGLVDSKKGTIENLEIPAQVTGEGGVKYTVTAIGYNGTKGAFQDDAKIKTVTFTANIESIGQDAFNNCYNMTTVTFPTGSKLATIGDGAFAETAALEKIDLSNTLVVDLSGVTPFVAGGNLNVSLEEIVLSVNTTDIGTALAGLAALKTTNISATRIEGLDPNAFDGDKKLTSLELPAVYHYNTITGLPEENPQNFTFENGALEGSFIQKLTVNGAIGADGVGVLGGSKLTEVTFNGVVGTEGADVAIVTGAFGGHYGLAKVTFGEVKEGAIGTGSFADAGIDPDDNTKVKGTVAFTITTAEAVVFEDKDVFGTTDFGDKNNVNLTAPNDAVGALDLNRVNFEPYVDPGVADRIKVYGESTFYGKFINRSTTASVAINRADAIVYSAYTDGSKVYMDPLQSVKGQQIIGPGQAVIVKAVATPKEDAEGGYKYIEVAKKATGTPAHTIRMNGDGIVNDIDYLDAPDIDPDDATSYISAATLKATQADKVLYVVGDLSKGLTWQTPKDAVRLYRSTVYIFADAAAAGGRLEVIWLDGSEEEATAIKSVKTATEKGAIYNLAGQKVNAAYKGVVIKDGKKYIQK